MSLGLMVWRAMAGPVPWAQAAQEVRGDGLRAWAYTCQDACSAPACWPGLVAQGHDAVAAEAAPVLGWQLGVESGAACCATYFRGGLLGF